MMTDAPEEASNGETNMSVQKSDFIAGNKINIILNLLNRKSNQVIVRL